MQVINFKRKDDAAIIEADGIDYIRNGENVPIPAYKHIATGNIIQPSDVYNCEFLKDTDLIVDASDAIMDYNGNIYVSVLNITSLPIKRN